MFLFRNFILIVHHFADVGMISPDTDVFDGFVIQLEEIYK